jgi:methyl-accepting chemotaxis protein
MSTKKYIEISVLEHDTDSNPVKQNILNSINTYLIRNKSAVSDFNLIKDIVDRNIDSEDDEINSKLSIPLYLGLIGTMIGIIVGLMFLPEITSMVGEETSNLSGIDDLLGGVKIAMIASFVGLSLTVYTSGFLYKGAKQIVEEQKNKFYSFIQANLLPKLTDNASTGIYSLQNNLLKFNDGFSENMSNFKGILNSVNSSLNSQVDLIEQLKRVDVSRMATANVTVLKELKYSLSQLENFGKFLEEMNSFVVSTKNLNFVVNQQLSKVENISEIVSNLNTNASNQIQLTNYLASHFQQFETREQHFSNSITKFDSHINDLLEKLKISFIERAQEYNNADVQLSDGFKELFFDIKKSMNEMFKEQHSNILELNKEISKLSNFKSEINKISNQITIQNEKIDSISNGNLSPFENFKLPNSIKWLFYTFLILGCIVFASFVYKLF